MAQVVIIHALEDALPARALAERLRRGELQVALERPPGEETRRALDSAAIAIALWSPRSVGKNDLVDDIAYARERVPVLHAVMQNAAAPGQFHQDRGVNLTGWRGEEAFPAWRQLAKFVAEAAGVSPPPPPGPQPDSGFFSPGRVAAAAGAPNPVRERQTAASRQQAGPAATQATARPGTETPRRRGSGMVMAALALAAIGGAGGGLYFWNQSQTPAADAASPLDNFDPNDVESLRALINGGSGALAERAREALAELEERSFEAASDADVAELEAFLREFPESPHALAARKQIEDLRRATVAESEGTAAQTTPSEPSPVGTAPAPEAIAPGEEPVLGEPPSLGGEQQTPSAPPT